jgi:hypothetical protein
VVVYAEDAKRFRIEYRIVDAEIAVNEPAIAGGHHRGVAHREPLLAVRAK